MHCGANSDSEIVHRDLHPEPDPHNLAGLIRKLRWARLEYEAEQLELVMCRFSADQRGTVCAEPSSTD